MEPNVNAVCSSLSALSDGYRKDRLSEEERRQWRAHLASCEACRNRVIGADPTMIFALAPTPVPVTDDRETRAILENVKAAIAIREVSRRLDGPASARHGRRAAAAVGTAALLALTLSAPLTRRPASVPAARPAAPNRISNAATKIVRPGAEDSSLPSSATIYEWNPGPASPDDPKIVWIVDRSLDL